jgi:hypothetical protein
VVDFTFPVTVGTKDCCRGKSRWAKEEGNVENDNVTRFSSVEGGYTGDEEYHVVNGDYYGEWDGRNEFDGFDDVNTCGPTHNISSIHSVPPPPPEDPVDEKEWLRQQAALLLPSQPPGAGGPSRAAAAPSAPFISEDAGPYGCHLGFNAEAGPSTPYVMNSAVSTQSGDTIVNGTGHESSRNYGPPAFDGGTSYSLQDDKQDLERQRLMAQASEPPEGDDGGAGLLPWADAHVPTAPILNEMGEYNVQTLDHERTFSEQLPQYR